MPQTRFNRHQSHLTPDHMIHAVDPDLYHEIIQLIEETADDIAQATTSTDPWPDLIIHLLASLEKHTNAHDPFEERLVTICEKITRRLNTNHW